MKIGVVLGSGRPVRLGERVAKFVLKSSAAVAGARFELLDLASYGLPFFDEPEAPRHRSHAPAPNVARWLSEVASADGLVFVTPEYNFAVPGVLKNALDFLGHEVDGKPASILSYSDTDFGGIIAAQLLQPSLHVLGMLVMPRSIPLAHADRLLNESGEVVEKSEKASKYARHVPRSLNELVKYAVALKELRLQSARA